MGRSRAGKGGGKRMGIGEELEKGERRGEWEEGLQGTHPDFYLD